MEHSLQKYDEMKPDVDRVVRGQTQVVNGILAEAEAFRKDPAKEYEVGLKLLQVKRGAPKNKRFLKLVSDEPGLKRQSYLAMASTAELGHRGANQAFQCSETTPNSGCQRFCTGRAARFMVPY